MSINTVSISGNLVRDPELKMAGQTPLLEMSIAVNERRKNASGEWEDVPNYFDVQVWGQRGESLSRFLQKGSKVAISGKLKQNRWETSEGQKRSRVQIVASDVDLMSKGGSNGSSATGATEQVEVFSEDIPFF